MRATVHALLRDSTLQFVHVSIYDMLKEIDKHECHG